MKYITYLRNKNLSQNTIKTYMNEYEKWNEFIKNNNPSKTLFVKYIKKCEKRLQANSVKLTYSAIISVFKYEKRWKLINQCSDIKLPQIQHSNRIIINLNEFNYIKSIIQLKTWYEKRNWLIFSFLFLTGIRVSELYEFNKNKIYEKNKIKIKGKGNKTRVIFICDYLLHQLNNWNFNKIAINKKNKFLSTKQIHSIIRKIGLDYFNKKISPHDLRRSFATNLLKNNANIEIVKKVLGHTNINTTARYLQFNDNDIINEINSILSLKIS